MAQGKHYSEYEIEYIKANYVKDGRRAVAAHLGRNSDQIGGVANRLGFNKPAGQQREYRRRGEDGNGPLTATGPAFGLTSRELSHDDKVREASERLGAACAALAAKSGQRA